MLRYKNKYLLALCVLIMGLVTACSSSPTPAPPIATPTLARTSTPTSTAAPTPTPTPDLPRSKDPTTFVYLTDSEPDTLDPHMDYTSAGSGVLQNIYEGLVAFDGSDPTHYVPALAESIPAPMPTDKGGVTYTWQIDRTVKFHDGHSLTAEDVAYSFWRSMLLGDSGQTGLSNLNLGQTPSFLLLEPFVGVDNITQLVDPTGKLHGDLEALQSVGAAKLEAACQKVKAAVTFDNQANSVTMLLPHPWAPFVPSLAGPWASIVNRQWQMAHGDWDGDCRTWQFFYSVLATQSALYDQANGTGPYQLDHWTPGQEIVLVGNAAYRAGPPSINRVIIKNVLSFDQRAVAFEAGEADAISIGAQADRAGLDQLVREKCNQSTGNCQTINPIGRLRVYQNLKPVSRTDALFNFAISKDSPFIGSGKLDGAGIPPDFFNDIHIRRAFNFCFDRQTYITQTLAGIGTQAAALTLPGLPGYADDLPMYAYDPDQCKAEFQAAVLKAKGGKSLWEAGFALQIPYAESNTAQHALATILANTLPELNAKFSITAVPLSLEDYRAALRAHQVPLMTVGWTEDIHDPNNWYAPYVRGLFANLQALPADLVANYEPLIVQGVTTIDHSLRVQVYVQLNDLIYADAPLMLLAFSNDARRYEPLYLKSRGSLNRNPLVPPFYYYEFSKN